ncbi:GNAT family N-acetyltransferase [Aquimarina sp. AU58]|uniref:GNAT family N-acetyltransferase n=1 Tax=Aquimarina sp. AU58 TaxID=1874112 RepID=UPI000D6E255B|nr:GNAT family N-acetyltransferase [Aquimarina sp. AU58]
MIIRFAKEGDIKQIVLLCKAHAIYEKTTFDSNKKAMLLLQYLFGSENALKCVVVEQNNELLGYATFMKQFSTWDADFYIYLDCLYLKEETRGKGIGTKIMAMVKEFAISEGCTIIQWQTPDFNTDAINFYKKTGAKSKAKERFFWKV